MRFVFGMLLCTSVLSTRAPGQPASRPPQRDTAAPPPFVVAPGASRSLPGRIAVKVSGQDNGGAFAVLEVPTMPGMAPDLHIHHVENEYFYVLAGEYLIRIGDQLVRLTAGGSAYGPRLIPHTWRDVGNGPGRLLVVAQPAGHIEAFTRDLEALYAAGPPSPDAVRALFAKHDMEYAGPPLPKPPERE